MAQYHADLQDIEFNLFDVLNIQRLEKFGLEKEDLKGVLLEYNKFVENEVFPTREETDVVGVKHVDGKVIVPEVLHKPTRGYYENGWFALGIPEEFGGTPAPEALTIACLSLSTGANVSWMMYAGLSKAALNVLRLKGDDFTKEKIIPQMMEGNWGGTMCLTEAGAGSDVGALKSTAKPVGDGKYAIKGVKIFISSGESDLYENNIHLVLARTPGAEEGTKGISLFLVPRFRINEDGSVGESNDVACTKIEHKMGIHGSATCELTFGANDKCEGWLIGEEFEGMANMFIMMNEARLHCGVQGEAQANFSYLMADKYVRERAQFGKEIIHHPDIRRSLLRMRAVSRGLRSICLYTADLFDKHHETNDEKYESYIGIMTPICKSYCSDQGVLISSEALSCFGGYGYCSEYGVEQFVRDTKIATIYEGTNGIQAIDFLMRKTLKDGGKSLTALVGEIAASVQGMDDKTFGKEKALMGKVLATSQGVVEFIGGLAKEKKFNQVLQHATDFLSFASTLIVAWRLYESAKVAQEKLTGASGEEKTYLESKLVDFRTYCAHYLIHNLSIAKTITEFNDDVSAIEL